MMAAFITIHSSQIRGITEKGISYVDDSATERFIDFHQCYLNYLKPRLTVAAYEQMKKLNPTMNFDPISYANRVLEWKEVAERNILGGYSINRNFTPNPYFKLHSTPPLVIECENETQFKSLMIAIGKAGWQSLDLS